MEGKPNDVNDGRLQGWVKLHRRLDNNKFLMKDNTARLLFMDLLRLVDKDTGSWAGGRFQLAGLCNLAAGTLYKALKRLEKNEIVTLVSNTRFTTIYICNWEAYQSGGSSSGSSEGAAKEQQREHSNKKLNTENKEGVPEFRTFFKQPKLNKQVGFRIKNGEAVKRILTLFTESTGGSFNNRLHQEAADHLVDLHGIDLVLERAEFGLSLKPQEYQIQISKPVDLGDHWQRLGEIMKERKGSKHGIRY